MPKFPIFLEDYLNYTETIKGLSPNTVKEYYSDLRTFLRFIKLRFNLVNPDIPFQEIEIGDIKIDSLKDVKLRDLHAYISYVDKDRDNGNYAKSRKVASIKSFFDYLHKKADLLENNPASDLESPKIESRHPVYLSLEEAEKLLASILENKNDYLMKRDYAIVTLFLNCGLRLSELTSININKLKGDDTITVIGKGNKERTIFLNQACIDAIKDYMEVRPRDAKEKEALFISIRGNRMSNRAVQHMIDKYLEKSGLDTDIYSTHKLRHTAATLMYKYGDVDIRALQEILGHESVATTQIYTHIDNERLRDAVKSNPLANIKK